MQSGGDPQSLFPQKMQLLRPNSQLGLTSAKKSLDNEPSKPGATLPVHGRWPRVRPLLALPPRGSPQTALDHPFPLLPSPPPPSSEA